MSSLEIDIVKIYQLKESHALYDTALTSSTAIVDMLYPLYKGLDREVVSVVGMNTRNYPNVINTITIGTTDSARVSPRDVFKPLILSNSVGYILLHNHPAGTLEPSDADVELTRKLKNLGKEMNIELIDHLILGCGKEHYSFRGRHPIFQCSK